MSSMSLDFLNMIKNSRTIDESEALHKNSGLDRELKTNGAPKISVIDTETNWNNEVMSIGVAIASADDYKCLDKKYYIIAPECYVGGIYSNVMNYGKVKAKEGSRDMVMKQIKELLDKNGVSKIMAYNAKFDYGHLQELGTYEWYDIMQVAAYKQYNKAIPDHLPCCKSGRLKTGYGVEPILRLLSSDNTYREIHNAVYDAVDELRILELLGHGLDVYEHARIN